METEIYLYRDDESWLVVVGDSVTRFPDRTAAFQDARERARLHAPSVIISNPPSTSAVHEPATNEALVNEEVPAMSSPRSLGSLTGPGAFGRSLLVSPTTSVPEAWRDCERIVVDEGLLRSHEFLAKVRHWYLTRTPMVFEISTDLGAPRADDLRDAVWTVGVGYEDVPETVWQLMTRNAIDLRGDEPCWPLGEQALLLGARPDADTDAALKDGTRVWCDGGPLRLWDSWEIESFGAVVVPREAIEVGLLRPISAAASTADLASDQLAAVSSREVRARIIAPAGSGKTRVLTERARHLVRSGVPASAMLLVAFNRRAQNEIVERTTDLPGLQVQTLNALGLSILNGTNGFVRREPPVQTIDERQVRELLGRMIQFPRRANTDPAASWIDALSEVRLGLRSPELVETSFDGDVAGFAEFFPRYRDELRRNRQVDFDEQIYGALELLLDEPEARDRAQLRSQVLLVDEFQDLTPAHLLMLRLLAGPAVAIFAVGDDDQTIYSYSGASPEWLVSFDEYVPMAEHHDLTVNYRCPVPAVEAARNLLSRNQYRVQKTILAGPENIATDESVQVLAFPIHVLATVDLVKAHLAAGAPPSEIAILTRVNTLLAPVQAALRSEGIAVQNRDGTQFLERTGVAAALAWMRLAVAGKELGGADIARAARRPTRGLSPRVIEWMGEQHDIAGLERLAARISDEKSAAKVSAFVGDLERVRALSMTATSAAILEFIRTETGLDQSMRALDVAHHGRNSAAHSDDLRALVALGHVHPDAATFHVWLNHALRPDDADGGITLATVHRVKGLEWPHVIVYDASAGIFPHRLSTDIEEERRVFHVAITRARTSLQIVADQSNPSIFLEELNTMASPSKELPGSSRSHSQDPVKSPRRAEGAGATAEIGLVFSWGGYDCTVSAISDGGVAVSIGSSTMTVPYGSKVSIAGRAAILTPAAVRRSTQREATDLSETDAALVAVLRSWRLERAGRDKVPAYVVFDDKTLEAIVVAMPSTESELLAVSGIGPKRVELYGNEVLALLETTRAAN